MPALNRKTAASLALVVLALGGCAAPGPEGSAKGGSDAVRAPVLAPPAALSAQGIPPVPDSLVKEVARYTDFRGHRFVAWHPTQREMLVSWRAPGASTQQLYRLSAPMAAPEPLTQPGEPVTVADYEPQGRYVVFERSVGGSEAAQLFRLDLADKSTTPLTEPGERHEMQQWLHRSSRLLYLSVPLDATAQAGTRTTVATTLSLVDPLQPASRRTLAELPGTGWQVGAVSWDDRTIALQRDLSANESQLWLMAVATGKLTQVLPVPAAKATAKPATWHAFAFTKDNASLWLTSDQHGEFNELLRYTIASKRLVPVTRAIPWDVDRVSQSADGRTLAARLNVDGRAELRLFDTRTLKEIAAQTLPDGSVDTLAFHDRRPELALGVNSAQAPSQVFSFNPVSREIEQWTRASSPPGVDPGSFGEQTLVRWKSFDDRSISAIVNTPPARFTGKRPVMVLIHGGPESQATAGFVGRYNYFVNELGITLIQPNVRGSAGYGKTFLTLDDGRKREDSVKDIGALLDWIATQPNLDASRVLVSGGSYGGYMSLAVATHYADRIAGSIDIVGISSFVTFLERTESYRRDLRRVEYGDEREPAMREFLQAISPLNQVERIGKPMFVVAGRNDPRVPYTEGEQIVARLRERGTPVWYLLAANEGHGFRRQENADYQFYATVLFVQQTLLK